MNTLRHNSGSAGVTFLKIVLGLVVLVVLAHGIATVLLGRRVESRIQAMHAKGDPVSMSDVSGPQIPDSENGGVIYAKVLSDLKDYRDNEKKEQHQLQVGPSGSRQYTDEELAWSVDASASAVVRELPGSWNAARRYVRPVQEMLPMLDDAAAKPQCRFKTNWKDWPSTVFPYYSQLRGLTLTLGVNACVDAKDGKMDAAVRSLTAGYKLTDSIKDDPTIIAMLVRVAIFAIDSATLKNTASYGHIDKVQARKLYDLLSGFDTRSQGVLALKGERACGTWMFKRIAGSHGRELVAGFTPDEAPAFLLRVSPTYAWRPMLYKDEMRYLDLMDQAISNATYLYRDAEARHLGERLEAKICSVPAYSPISRFLTPVFTKAMAKRDEATAAVNGDQIFLALLAYKDTFGEYPESLKELRAKLGWQLKEDPFSGKDFIYKRQGSGFLLYSIGGNMRDDKGLSIHDHKGPSSDSPYDDISWRMHGRICSEVGYMK